LLYPALRKTANNPQQADASLREHQEAKEVLEKIRKVKPNEADFQPLLNQLVRSIRHHVKEEESIVLPQLQEAISPEDLVSMGGHFMTAKKLAPPTPHPEAPQTPPFNVAMAPIATFLDKLKQVVKREPSSAQA